MSDFSSSRLRCALLAFTLCSSCAVMPESECVNAHFSQYADAFDEARRLGFQEEYAPWPGWTP